MLTGTMRHNTLLLPTAIQPARLLLQPLNRMEGPSRFEGAHTLHVLTLEPQPQHRSCRRPPGVSRAGQLLRRAGCRRQLRQGPVRQHGGEVHVRLDQLVRLDNRVPRQRGRRREIRHGGLSLCLVMVLRCCAVLCRSGMMLRATRELLGVKRMRPICILLGCPLLSCLTTTHGTRQNLSRSLTRYCQLGRPIGTQMMP